MRTNPCVVLPLLSFTAMAQTFVVDVNGGPGTNFTSIAAATAAVPSGSRLLVQPGTYASFAIVGKSVVVDAAPGVILDTNGPGPTIAINGLTSTQEVVLRGLTWTSTVFFGNTGPLVADNCAGLIVIDGMRIPSGEIASMQFSNCDRVVMRDYRHEPSLLSSRTLFALTNAHCVFERCDLGGLPSPNHQSAVVQMGGSTQFVDCSINGGSSLGGPIPAIQVQQGGDVRVCGTTTIQAFGFLVAGSGIDGNGTVRVDPTVVFSNVALPYGPGITPIVQAMPSVVTPPTAGSGAVTSTLRASPGLLGVMFASLPGPRTPLPGFSLDPSWQDAASLVPVAFGIMSSTGQLEYSATLSVNAPLLMAVQGLTYGSGSGFELSAPSFVRLP